MNGLKSINYNPDVLNCLANLSNDEVFTTPETVNNMLNLLPKEIWSQKQVTFLDPFSKTGVFLREITKRLIVGLEEEFPDLEERIDHILTNQVYGIAITELTALLTRRTLYCSKHANSKYSICSTFLEATGNIVFDKCTHSWSKGMCSKCGANKEIFDRDNSLENYAYPFLHKDIKEMFDVNFDVIIGNPPYQLNDGGGTGASAMPLYHKFVQMAKNLNPKYITMIIPSRWFAGGKGLDPFRTEMLNDYRIRFLADYPNAKECFPSNNISGGVCYFLWDKDFSGNCEYKSIVDGKETVSVRKLNEYPIFVRYSQALSIIQKISATKEAPLSDEVSPRNIFGIHSSERGSKASSSKMLTLYHSQGIGRIDSNKVIDKNNMINKYKVIIGKAISGRLGETDKNGQVKVLTTVKTILPNEVCTDSYLVIKCFDTEDCANNLQDYLKTKFSRFLLLQALTSMNISKEKFCFIPTQDFSQKWDDESLYKKYNLSQDDIQFIESMIKPMGDEA